MANLKDFFNTISNDNRIFTREDIGNMSTDEFRKNEKAIDYQLANLGVPTNSDLANSEDVIYVHAYTKDDGTKVRAHYRSKRGGNRNLNNQPVTSVNSNQNKMTPGEAVLDILGMVASLFMPVAGSNLQNARRNFLSAKGNDNAHIINSRSEIQNKGLNNLMDDVGIPKNSRGVIYDINSKQSKNLFKSSEIQDFISKNYSTLVRNKQNPTTDIEFTPHELLDDNYLGLQNCKLYNPHITSDGYFNATILDYFDFKYRNRKNLLDYKSAINNLGYSLQEKNLLENQFSIYQIQGKL